jgi:hypothetical protein
MLACWRVGGVACCAAVVEVLEVARIIHFKSYRN